MDQSAFFYPQLRDVKLPPNPDRDSANFAKFEAIQEATEKEYLNAILATLPRRFHEVDRALFIIVVELGLLLAVVCYRLLF